MKKYYFVTYSVKSALKEFYRLELISKKRNLENIEKSTMNGIKYSIVGLTNNDIPEEIKKEIENGVNKMFIRRAKL